METLLLKGLKKVVKDFKSLNLEFALVGGLAVSFRSFERATKDIDFSIAVSNDKQAEEIIRSLLVLGYQQYQILDHKISGRLATARLGVVFDKDSYQIICDLLFYSTGQEDFITKSAEEVELLPGLVMPVAKSTHLLAMKLLSYDPIRRAQDGQDILELLKVVDERDYHEIFYIIDKIEEIKHNRDKDLRSVFDSFLKAVSDQ